MIRLPSHVSDAVRKLERARLLLFRRLGRQPTTDELAAEAKLPATKIAALMQSAQEPLSLDALLGESEETPLGDLLLDLAAPDPEHSTIRARNREALEDILSVLRPRERRVIEKRFGFADGRVYSLQEVGDQLQMSREGVRQIEVRALKKLKQAVSVYYDDMIQSLVTGLRAAFHGARNIPKLSKPIPLVLSGGSALPRGFRDRFEKIFKETDFPIDISEIRVAADPLTATAKGALVAALCDM